MEPFWSPKFVFQVYRYYPALLTIFQKESSSWYTWVLETLKTTSLVTQSGMKTMVFPSTIFGICSAFSGEAMTSNCDPTFLGVISHVPHTFIYCWNLIFVFDLCSQRLTQSIIEDRVNKPWRPHPLRAPHSSTSKSMACDSNLACPIGSSDLVR